MRGPTCFRMFIVKRCRITMVLGSAPPRQTRKDFCELARLRARLAAYDQARPSVAGYGRSRNVQAGGNGGEGSEVARFAAGRRLQRPQLSEHYCSFLTFPI